MSFDAKKESLLFLSIMLQSNNTFTKEKNANNISGMLNANNNFTYFNKMIDQTDKIAKIFEEINSNTGDKNQQKTKLEEFSEYTNKALVSLLEQLKAALDKETDLPAIYNNIKDKNCGDSPCKQVLGKIYGDNTNLSKVSGLKEYLEKMDPFNKFQGGNSSTSFIDSLIGSFW